jgi:hypothetical protein
VQLCLCFQRLTPNTGIGRFSLSVFPTRVADFVCHVLHDADHLDGARISPSPIVFDGHDGSKSVDSK